MKWISKRFNLFSIDIPYISVNLKYSKITLPRTKSLNILWSISSNFQKVKKKEVLLSFSSDWVPFTTKVITEPQREEEE